MQKFTKQQSDYILNSRRAFNANERAFAANLSQYQGSELMGCASPIPKDAWGDWDQNGNSVARSKLAVFTDIAMTNSKAVDLAVLVDHYQQISDSGDVNVSLDGRGKSKEDQALVKYEGTPLPIYDSVAAWGWRQMLQMQRAGGNLESTTIGNHQRKIADRLETMVISGESGIVVAGDTIYGLTNHPDRNTRSTGVTLNGATGAQWKTEIVATMQLNHADNMREPETIYVNWDDWFYATTTPYDTTMGEKKISAFIEEIPNVAKVVPASSVAVDTIICLQKERGNVEMLNGMPMVQRPINRLNTEDDFKVKVMAAQALQLKTDYTGQMGLAVST